MFPTITFSNRRLAKKNININKHVDEEKNFKYRLLDNSALSAMPTLTHEISTFNYNRSKLKVGILHFGIGNIFRGYIAPTVDDLISKGRINKETAGIAAVNLRTNIRTNWLASQDGLYTLITCNFHGEKKYSLIGSLKKVYTSHKDFHQIIKHLIKNQIHTITISVTSAGLCLKNIDIDLSNECVLQDLKQNKSVYTPASIYGWLEIIGTISIYYNLNSLNVIPFENVKYNGSVLKENLHKFLIAKNGNKLNLIRRFNFTNTVVDRISVKCQLPLFIGNTTKYIDRCPIEAEEFSKFYADEPSFFLEEIHNSSKYSINTNIAVPFDIKRNSINLLHLAIVPFVLLSSNRYFTFKKILKSESIKILIFSFLTDNLKLFEGKNSIYLSYTPEKIIHRLQNNTMQDDVMRLCKNLEEKILLLFRNFRDTEYKSTANLTILFLWFCIIVASKKEMFDSGKICIKFVTFLGFLMLKFHDEY
jgi:mannitol-1-phosphate/altronate dehydrogenase